MTASWIIPRRPGRTFLSVMLWAALAGSAAAEPFPSGIIRIVVPPGPGTPPDIISRIVADELAATEGWRLIVENRPGAL